ncbi:hypothetical protein NBRC116602_07630 [Hyphomicrobiales bacterium 4NK60-0047b]
MPEEGTKVRCTSCSHVWMATSDDVFENAALAEASAQAEDSLPEDVSGIPAISPSDEDPLEELDFEEIEEEIEEEIDAGGDELDQAELDSLFEEMGVEPEPEPEPEPEEENSQGDIDSLFDEVGDEPEEENSQGDIDSLFDEMGDEPEEENSQDDIDGLFDEPAAEPEEENNQDDIDGLFDEPSSEEGEENSQGDIDGLFDEDPTIEESPVEEPVEEEPIAAATEDLEDPFDNEIEEVDDQPTPETAPLAAKLPIWKRMGREEMIGWGCYVLCVILVFSTVIMARVSLVKAIPSMANVYSVLGMDVNVRGLTFTNVQQKWVIEDNRLLLKVQGEVTNLTNRYKTLPPMVFGAVGTDKKEIFRWVMRVRKKPLLPGEKAPFMAMVPLPPKQAKHLYISFQ